MLLKKGGIRQNYRKKKKQLKNRIWNWKECICSMKGKNIREKEPRIQIEAFQKCGVTFLFKITGLVLLKMYFPGKKKKKKL